MTDPPSLAELCAQHHGIAYLFSSEIPPVRVVVFLVVVAVHILSELVRIRSVAALWQLLLQCHLPGRLSNVKLKCPCPVVPSVPQWPVVPSVTGKPKENSSLCNIMA